MVTNFSHKPDKIVLLARGIYSHRKTETTGHTIQTKTDSGLKILHARNTVHICTRSRHYQKEEIKMQGIFGKSYINSISF